MSEISAKKNFLRRMKETYVPAAKKETVQAIDAQTRNHKGNRYARARTHCVCVCLCLCETVLTIRARGRSAASTQPSMIEIDGEREERHKRLA